MSEQGQVKWFNNKTGWGFIARPDSPDVFLRHDRIEGDGFKVVQPGDCVAYELRKGKQGPYAVHVVIIENGAGQRRPSGAKV